MSTYLGKEGVRINIIAPGIILFKGSTWEKKIKMNKNLVKKIIEDTECEVNVDDDGLVTVAGVDALK